MPVLQIDGRRVEVESGTTLLAAAATIGVDIPTLCHNQRISRTTSCFVCLVKDMKTGKFMPSCSALAAEGMEVDASSAETCEMRKTALELLLSEHLGDCEAPCTIACPAHAQVEEYVRAGREGNFLEALQIIKKRIPLPMSIGRICPRFCEKDCRRNVDAEPVAINEFKRLAADLYFDEYMEELPPLTGRRVAVVGGGPAGLSAAYYLRLEGIAPTIYERMPEPGGMLRYEIPEFRLPKSVVAREVEHLRKMGVVVECGKELGKDLRIEDLSAEFDAVVLGIGCWKATSMRVAGEELADDGIEWLKNIAMNNYQGAKPGVVVVVGGGSTAMDCCRVPLRLGAESVTCVYRRTEKEMPAEPIEYHEACEEGVRFEFLTAPTKLSRRADGKLVLECQKMELGEPDASGRRRPVPIAGSEFELAADLVIAAIGQGTDAPDGVPTNKWGDVAVNENYRVSGNIFAGGDCVSGAATVVEAVTGGRKAALAVSNFLLGSGHQAPPDFNVSRGHWQHLRPEDIVKLREPAKEARITPDFIPMEERRGSFRELFPTFADSAVMAEGKRCLECSCTARDDCKLKLRSEEYGAKPDAIRGELPVVGYDNRHPSIIHDRMKCVKCGICVKICAEVVNKTLLSQKNRGFATKVETAFGEVLPDSCSDCGECVRECPVGALDWKDKAKRPPKAS